MSGRRSSDVTYAALLRGVNVGGRNKVPMARLRAVFEAAGMTRVRTYINSGNVIFDAGRSRTRGLASRLEEATATELGFPVPILLEDRDAMTSIRDAIPASWKDDSTMRCYVMFLWGDVDRPSVVDDLTVKDGIDDVKYVPGALVWRVDRAVLTRSGMAKLPGTPLYGSMTIRNCNTVRKLVEMMSQPVG